MRTVRRLPQVLFTTVAFATLLTVRALNAQSAAAVPVAAGGNNVAQTAEATATDRGTVLDRVVAVVNGDLVLESDVDEEQRFSVFLPPDPRDSAARPRAAERLINRALILQQLKIQPQAPVTDKEIDTEILQLRKEVPACKVEHCETDAGWAKFLSEHGITEAELHEHWRLRMEVLRFIEQRFRMGARVSPEEIKAYYEQTLLPQYAKQNVKPPKLEAISDRIQEVLLQQQVSSLLGDWLKSLRAQGTVRVIGHDEAATHE